MSEKNITSSPHSFTFITKGPQGLDLREKHHQVIARALELPDPYEGLSVEPRHQISLEEMAISLYWRSPPGFLFERETDELISILHELAEAYIDYQLQHPPFHLAVRQHQDKVRLYVVSPDRPFIIRSLASVFEDLKVNISIVLHPIFKRAEESVSAVYIELEECREDTLRELIERTKLLLHDVMLLTQDHAPMFKETESIATLLRQSVREQTGKKPLEANELAELLFWLTRDNFLLSGALRWDVLNGGDPGHEISPVETSRLGILSNDHPDNLLHQCLQDAQAFAQDEAVYRISRLHIRSRVQRAQRLTHIMVKVANKSRTTIHSLIGLFTVAASQQTSSEIPSIRKRLGRIIKLESVSRGSYNYKFIVRALDNMPKELALNLPIDILRQFINVAIGVHNHNHTRIAAHISLLERRADVLVAMPKHSFSTKVESCIREHLELRFGCPPEAGELYIDHSADAQVRVYVHLPLDNSYALSESIFEKLEQEITELTRSWSEKLEAAVRQTYPYPASHDILSQFCFGDSFPLEYQAVCSVEQCQIDIDEITALSKGRALGITVNRLEDGEDGAPEAEITVYSKSNTIPTNKSLPIFENMGLSMRSNTIYEVTTRDNLDYYIHRFVTVPSKALRANPELAQTLNSDVFSEGLSSILEGEMENDVINNLILGAGLPYRAISVLRAYAGYLWQVIKYATRGTIYHTLARSPLQSTLLWKLFTLRFRPNLDRSNFDREQETLVQEYLDSLRAIKNINQDRILRSLLRVILSTHRTNFYQSRSTLAFKIYSRDLDILPDPKPYYEIYVRSTQFEGVHLRGGKTARGGIRWSERTEDYRNEILGLMKTQIIKNVLIVPTGAKGGFAVRYLPDDPQVLRTKVENCYKEFIRAILSITDNLLEGSIISPANTVTHDEADPYLVVAADKGTATFSDIANKIAKDEFNFWLGDAFASGGSNGYDHKKYGITARGAWESVKRHFHNSKFDYLSQPFTVVGIGDMSGDVFGNGLLISDKAKLVAAFNHVHIFIDPDPDPWASYCERKRLFELPRSSWLDYKAELISEGGGVYDRYSKEILISNQAREVLGIERDTPLNGEELIRLILQAPVKLLWNGGIGTYIKSSNESHSEVNDGTNDNVRVDANNLRCEIVGEGGNLGFTQKARIEFSKLGGRIISDAIDNSGGVDLSDHEVNIKLGLSILVKDGSITEQERNLLLVEIVPEVVEQVLQHNRNHSSILSLGLSRSEKSIHYFQSLLRELERQGYIDRGLESLPTAEDLLERAARKEGLYMPELAVCMAAVKMWIKDRVVQSPLVQDPLLESYLLDYFPAFLRGKFFSTLVKHPLRQEIIATQVTNSLIDAIGITFVLRMCMSHSVQPITVVKCVMAAELLLGSREVRERIRIFDTPDRNDMYMSLLGIINSGVRHATSWLIGWHGQDLPLDRMVELYRAPHSSLILAAESFFPADKAQKLSENLNLYQEAGLTESIARRLVLFEHIPSCFNILASVRSSQNEAARVGEIYFAIVEALRLDSILGIEDSIDTVDKWDHQVLSGALENINKALSRVTSLVLRLHRTTSTEGAKHIIERSPSYPSHRGCLEEIQAEKPNAMSLSVLARQLANFQIPKNNSDE
jgi:glutamate dehydrogenase